MKYIIKFEKTGTMCYISHLDIIKVFKRAFKRAGIRLAYSQGFNPHPKMGFAQPLSLGYRGLDERIEFETAQEEDTPAPEKMMEMLSEIMPAGIRLMSIESAYDANRTLAARTEAAEYDIRISLRTPISSDPHKLWELYMGRDEITAMKKQKKKKEPVPVNIRPKIREMTFKEEADELMISCTLDAGSDSNLSPELVLDTLAEIAGLDFDRNEVEVTRTKIHFRDQ